MKTLRLLSLLLVVGIAHAQVQPTVDNTPATLTNKTISGNSNTISGSLPNVGISGSFAGGGSSPACSGNCDVLIGVGAGANLPAGDFLTTALGFHAMNAVTSANSESTAVGWNSQGNLTEATSGKPDNTTVGVNTLGNCVTNCRDNVVVGTDAMRNIAGTAPGVLTSVAIGPTAMIGNSTITSFQNDIAIGSGTFGGGTNGGVANDDVAIGVGAMANVGTSSQTVAIGTQAGNAGTSFGSSVAIGYQSALLVQGGFQHVFIGAKSGNTITGGQGDVVIGYNCQPTTNTTSFEVDICAGSTTPVFKITGGNTPSTSVTTVPGTLNSVGAISQNGALLALSIPTGTATFAVGSGVTSVVCASGYSCNNTRGTLTIVGGTATTGTIATVSFSATLSAAPACFAQMNGGATVFSIGNGAPSTTSFTITAGISVIGATFNVNYQCQP